MQICEIVTLNSIWSICNRKAATELNNDFCYEKDHWIQKQFKKEKITYTIRMIEAREQDVHWIHTGLIPSALKILERRGIEYSYESRIPEIEFDEPEIVGIDFRPYQSEAIEALLENGRGVIWHATGTGKSITIAGIMSAFSQETILFLVHTQDLVAQMKKDLIKFFGIDNVGEYSGKEKNMKRITVATIQSFSKVVEDFVKIIDVVIVDEAHHCRSKTSMYGKVLQTLESPIKVGATATLPDKREGKLWLEALIGPVIHEYGMNEAGSDGTLAKPEIEIIRTAFVPIHLLHDEKDLITVKNGVEKYPTKYRTVYWNGIVKNIARNMQILHKAEEEVKKGNSVLITVINQQHGKELMKVSKDSGFNLSPIFVYGKTSKENRLKIKKQLDKKEIMCVIASVIWSEGLDIPSLNTCILAGAGKSEIGALQRLGRILRKALGKDTATLIDFDDTAIDDYLMNHYLQRRTIYEEMGWLK